jgi:alpha-mannosidase
MLAQRLSTGELVFLTDDIPGFGSRYYRIVEGKCTITGACRLNNNILENGLIKVEINETNGNIKSLVDISSGYEYADKKINDGLNSFRYYSATGSTRPDSAIFITIKESGSLVCELQVSSLAPGCRSVSRSVRLVHAQPWVEISNIVDKLPLIAKDGVHFGFNFNIPECKTHVDIPWGIMRIEDDQWETANRSFLAFQHWVDISSAYYGVTWTSLDAPLFESGGITATKPGLSIVGKHKLSPSSIIYSYVMNNLWETNWPLTQNGPVKFRYRILPHGPFDASNANRFGVEQSQPLIAIATNSNPVLNPLIKITNDKVTITILKSIEDGKSMIIRFRSFSDKDELVKMSWPSGSPDSVSICNRGEESGEIKAGSEVIVPAMGMLTLRADW